jgi:hypothetical protein
MLKYNEFYCVKCRSIVKAAPRDIFKVEYKNKNRGLVPALNGYCKCGTKMVKFISE